MNTMADGGLRFKMPWPIYWTNIAIRPQARDLNISALLHATLFFLYLVTVHFPLLLPNVLFISLSPLISSRGLMSGPSEITMSSRGTRGNFPSHCSTLPSTLNPAVRRGGGS
jgi:hypothetical protein